MKEIEIKTKVKACQLNELSADEQELIAIAKQLSAERTQRRRTGAYRYRKTANEQLLLPLFEIPRRRSR